MIEKTRRLGRIESSEYLLEVWGIRRSPKTLAKLASTGGGPKYYRAGREALYSPSDLDDWAVRTLGTPVNSTSELRA